MVEQPDPVQLVLCERIGNGKAKVAARRDDGTVHMDTLDLASAVARKRFAKALREKLPAADPQAIEAELLQLADAPSAASATTAEPIEVDVSRIARPEQFHVPDVSGMAVPVVLVDGGKPAGRWRLFLRWADGRRQVRQLSSWLDLPGGAKLWLHPVPGEPCVTAVSCRPHLPQS